MEADKTEKGLAIEYILHAPHYSHRMHVYKNKLLLHCKQSNDQRMQCQNIY